MELLCIKNHYFFNQYYSSELGEESLKGFNYDLPSQATGECWGISAHKNGPSIVKSGKYKGLTLKQLWDEHRGLFENYQAEQFPLLTKILDTKKIYLYKYILMMNLQIFMKTVS